MAFTRSAVRSRLAPPYPPESSHGPLPALRRARGETSNRRDGFSGEAAEASDIDGVHLDPPQQRKLALAVKEVVEPLL